ncbi:hypothetical protein Bca101_061898 [Brassica carinata]
MSGLGEEPVAIYVASRRLSSGTAVATLHYDTAMRSYSPSFREERDTFGLIHVRSDKFLGAQTQRRCRTSKLVVTGDRERMSEPIVRAFGVLKSALSSLATEMN